MPDAANTKIVRCCHCRGMMKVSARALSVFCPHCQKRASLESLRIIGSHPGRSLATCGDIFIEPTAKLNLAITADNVIVHGQVRGPIKANHLIEVGPTGRVFGDIAATKIVVRDGAVMEGRCHMTPPARPRTDPPPQSPSQQAQNEKTDPEAAERGEASQAGAATASDRPKPLPPPPRKIRPLKLT